MSRLPFQVLVIPFRIREQFEVAIFKREKKTGGCWQCIAGGGEANESPIDAARREAQEEAGIPTTSQFNKLDTISSIPRIHFPDAKWAKDIFVIPEYCFAVKTENHEIRLSNEHTEYKWVNLEEALKLLKWDSNKTAVWELFCRTQKEAFSPFLSLTKS